MTPAAPDAFVAPPGAAAPRGGAGGGSAGSASFLADSGRPWLLAVLALGLALAVALTALAMVTAHQPVPRSPIHVGPAAVGGATQAPSAPAAPGAT